MIYYFMKVSIFFFSNDKSFPKGNKMMNLNSCAATAIKEYCPRVYFGQPQKIQVTKLKFHQNVNRIHSNSKCLHNYNCYLQFYLFQKFNVVKKTIDGTQDIKISTSPHLPSLGSTYQRWARICLLSMPIFALSPIYKWGKCPFPVPTKILKIQQLLFFTLKF